jgi:hypothetical protein
MTLTREGWDEVSKHLAELLERLDAIKARDAARMEADPDTVPVEATAVMMLFETALAELIEAGGPGALTEDDDLADVAPPSEL